MHNLTKIKLFRILLCITYVPALLFIYPFALAKKKNKGKLFFFFDRYSIGGAQRVHIDILNSLNSVWKQLYFTRLSPDSFMKDEFHLVPNTELLDIHFWCDNLLLRLFTVHYYAFYINRHRHAHVFSSNSTFFYDMVFFLNKKIIKTELLHNFTYGNNGMEFFGLANHKYLNNRLQVDYATCNNIISQYDEFHIPEIYKSRLLVIEPGVLVPQHIKKDRTLPVKVMYAGRGGTQKRIYLMNKIAEHCIKEKIPVQFHFAGTMMDELSEYVKKHSIIHGEISEPEKMYELYRNCHVILMTSAYEGFPMLIKEGMANGCIPVVTALDGNRSHLDHNENALLIQNPENEKNVIAEGIHYLQTLTSNPIELQRLSTNAYKYAQKHFDKANFVTQYQNFFNDNTQK